MKNLIRILGCAVLIALVSGIAKADTVFNVSGNAYADAGQACGVSCAFTGTLSIDTTTGTVGAVDITLPGLSTFNDFVEAYPYGAGYVLDANNSSGDFLNLAFTTTTPGTLVGFQGGTITSGLTGHAGAGPTYSITSGTISAPAPSATPEPSSLMLLGSGMLGLAGLARRGFR